MFFLPVGLPDGTYQFGVKNSYCVAIRIPKEHEINQNKQYFIYTNNEERYKPIALERLSRLLETL